MNLTRRRFFGLLGGAAVATVIPAPLMALAEPEVACFDQVQPPMRGNHVALVENNIPQARDYYSIEWPTTAKRYELGVYAPRSFDYPMNAHLPWKGIRADA